MLFNPERQSTRSRSRSASPSCCCRTRWSGRSRAHCSTGGTAAWCRRGRALRMVLTLMAALGGGPGVTGAPLYLGALATIGVSRFVQAGLSAGLPHVVSRAGSSPRTRWSRPAARRRRGRGELALALGGLIGAGDAASGAVAAIAAVGSVLIVVVALGSAGGRSAPTGATTQPRAAAVAHGLVDGARAGAPPGSWRRSGPSRRTDGLRGRDPGDAAAHAPRPDGLGSAAGGHGRARRGRRRGARARGRRGGHPVATARLGRPATVRIMLSLAAAALLALGLPMTLPTLLGASFVLGLVGQAIKLCSDAAVQREVDDAHRGRVFALSDTVFNVTYVVAVAGAARSSRSTVARRCSWPSPRASTCSVWWSTRSPCGPGSRRQPARRTLGHRDVRGAVTVDVGEQHVPARRPGRRGQ